MSINTPEINIKDLVLDEPQKFQDRPFDPEHDLTSTDWLELTTQLEEYKAKGLIGSWMQLARCMGILSPERASQNIDQAEAWEIVKDVDSSFDMPGRAGPAYVTTDSQIFIQALNLRVLCPSYIKEVKRNWIKLDKLVERMKAPPGRHTTDPIHIKAAIKLLYPNQKVGLDQRDSTLAKIALKWGQDDQKWDSFIHGAALTKLIHAPSYAKFGLGKEDWAEMKEALDNQRREARGKGDWGSFALFASWLAIMAAPNPIITEQGIDLGSSEGTIDSEDYKIPESRRF